ncbi:MAG: hypothetical protein AAF570_05225, partial [Bacteroidota bacterium]
MATETQDDLLTLASSLSPSLQRYVRISLKNESPAQLNEMLHLLLRHREQPAAFTQAIAQKFPHPKRRSKLRMQLYEALLDALARYDRDQQPDLKLHRIIQHCRVLQVRGLNTSGNKLIRKGLKLARKYERKWAVAILTELRSHLGNLPSSGGDQRLAGEAMFQESYLAAREFAELSHLRYCDALMANLFNHEGAVGKNRREFFAEMKSKAQKATQRSGFIFPYLGHHLLGNIAFLEDDQPAMSATWEEVGQLFDQYPHMRVGMEHGYLRALHFRILMAISEHDGDRAGQLLGELLHARPKLARLQPLWCQTYFSSLGQFAQNLCKPEVLRQFTTTCPDQLSQFAPRMEEVYVLLIEFLMASCLYLQEAYEAALRWIHRALHSERSAMARKTREIMLLIRLCIYVALEDWDTLETMLPATRKAIARHPVFPEFWEMCDPFFMRLIRDTRKKAVLKAFQDFEAACQAHFRQGKDQNII